MSAKPRSTVSEIPSAKVSPATPRLSRYVKGAAKSDADSSSPLQSSRLSVDRSPRSGPSKPTTAGRSPKLTAPTEKKTTPTRASISKPSELRTEVNQAHEDLKKVKEKLGLVEKEKEKALDELREAQRSAEEANEKLREALMAQKRAEEDSEIEKFRSLEIEQTNIEVSQMKEGELQAELEAVKGQHSMDVAALLSANQEIQKAKQELKMICDAKDQALLHADDVTKIAEAHVVKIESLSAELAHLKSVFDSRVLMEASKNNRFVSELQLEMESLRQELEKAKDMEVQMAEKEASLEQVNVDLEAARMEESYARSLAEELHERVEELASQAEEAKRLEISTSKSLESVMKQLEGSSDSLRDAESVIATLKENVSLLENSFMSQKKDFEESKSRLQQAENEALEMGNKVQSLKAELELVKEEKTQSQNNEKIVATSVLELLEEKNKLVNELGTCRDDEEKSKKALESLDSALHEALSEARDTKEKLLYIQGENENYKAQIEDLRIVLKATNGKYESMLDESNQEIDALNSSIQQSRHDHENSKAEWDQKELHLTNSVKKFEEENSSLGNKINILENLVKTAGEEAVATRDEGNGWKNSYKEAELEIIRLKEIMGEAKAERMKLKEDLMDRENELQNIIQESEEIRKREGSSQKKVEELSISLEEALAMRQEEEKNKSESEKEYDLLPKVVEFYEQNGTMGDVKKLDVGLVKEENEDLDSAEVKMWESCKIEEKDFSPDAEKESLEDEVESKAESFDQVNGEPLVSANESLENGGGSPSKLHQSQKKKKALLQKFGNLLKKKSSSSNQK